MMVKCLYDPAIHYSDKQFKIKNKRTDNVQSEIEKPYIYILARCPPTDDQIKYVQTRVEDLKEMKIKIDNEQGEIIDKMRFFSWRCTCMQF